MAESCVIWRWPISLLLLLEMVHVDVVGLVDLAHEEVVVCEKFFWVNGRLVQEHTSDDSGNLVSIDLLDGGINTVSDEVLSLFTLHLLKVGKVNLWKLKEVLLLLLLTVLVSTLWSSVCSLGARLFVIAILLLATLMTLILLWILGVVMLAFTLTVATSALSSTAASVSTSTSVVIFVSLVTFAHHLGWGILIPLHWLHSLNLVLRLVLAPKP